MFLWAMGHLSFGPASCYYLNSSGAGTGKQVSLLLLSPLTQVSVRTLGRCSFTLDEGTRGYTMQCQPAARGGWRRAPACGTPPPAARALTPATEYMGRKERDNLLLPLLVMQEEHRERYKSQSKIAAPPGSTAFGVHWSPEQLEFFWELLSSPQLDVPLTKERGIWGRQK